MPGLTPEESEAVRRFAAWKHRRKQPVHQGDDVLPPQDVYAEMMKADFAPALRDAGMRGSKGRFEFSSDEYWVQLGFQKSAFSDGQEVQFTVNLSVIGRELWAKQAAAKPFLGKRPTPTIRYGDWADQVRIGHVTPEGEDKWWRMIRGVDARPLAENALADLTIYGLPWLRQRSGI